MTTMMTAARLVRPGEPLSIDRVPVPEPLRDEVIVQVRACGLCGTDLHLAVEGSLPVERTPITLGHEAAGVIARVGVDVKTLKEGDRVVLFPAASCGMCRYCAMGRESLCDRARVYGMNRDGSLAEFVSAPARSVLPLPKGVPFDIGAVVTDGVATPFHALRTRGQLRAGETVGVVGCGGLGTHAIQLAKLMGAARIFAIDVDSKALERAVKLGADVALNPKTDDVKKRVRQDTGAGFDLVLEFVGHAETVVLAQSLCAKLGRVVVVGVGPQKPELLSLVAFVGRELSVMGSFGMDRRDIEDLLALVASGRLDLSASISARYPLADAHRALMHLNSKEGGVVRVVVEPMGLGA